MPFRAVFAVLLPFLEHPKWEDRQTDRQMHMPFGLFQMLHLFPP